jgi:hypothetical protein
MAMGTEVDTATVIKIVDDFKLTPDVNGSKTFTATVTGKNLKEQQAKAEAQAFASGWGKIVYHSDEHPKGVTLFGNFQSMKGFRLRCDPTDDYVEGQRKKGITLKRKAAERKAAKAAAANQAPNA